MSHPTTNMVTSATRRLHSLLGQIRQEGNRLGSGTPIYEVLKRLFESPSMSVREAAAVYYELIQLADEAIREVETVYAGDEGDSQHMQELAIVRGPLDALRSALLGSSVLSPVGPLLQQNPGAFEVQAVTVSRAIGRTEPPAADLQSAKDNLRDALEEVLASEFSADLKETFRKGIEDLVRILERFDIFGPEAVVRNVGQMTGEIAVRAGSTNAETRAAISAALNRVADAVTIVSGTVSVGQALRPLVQLFLGP